MTDRKQIWALVCSHTLCPGVILLSASFCLLLLQPPSVLCRLSRSPAACFQICPPSSPHPKKFHFSDDWYSWWWWGGRRKMDGGTRGQRARGRDGEERRWPLSPLSARTVKNGSLNSFNLQRGGGKLKGSLFFLSPSGRRSALVFFFSSPFSARSLVSVSLQPPLGRLRLSPPFSPSFTAGSGYSFRRQARSVSLLLEVTARRREREEEVGGRKRRKKGGEKAIERKQSATTAM